MLYCWEWEVVFNPVLRREVSVEEDGHGRAGFIQNPRRQSILPRCPAVQLRRNVPQSISPIVSQLDCSIKVIDILLPLAPSAFLDYFDTSIQSHNLTSMFFSTKSASPSDILLRKDKPVNLLITIVNKTPRSALPKCSRLSLPYPPRKQSNSIYSTKASHYLQRNQFVISSSL